KPPPAPPKSEPKPAKELVEAPAAAKPRHQKNGEPVPSDKKIVERDTSEDGDAKPSKRTPIKISLNREAGSSSAASRERAEADAREKAQAAAQAFQTIYNSKLKGVLGAIGQGISTGTSIQTPGPGGAAFADYGQFVVLVYKQAWTPPPE